MNINGIIMQKRGECLYQGIEGHNWYLNHGGIKELDLFFYDNIEKAWENSIYVDACTDMKYIQRYIDISKKDNIDYRVLACITGKELPRMSLSEEIDMNFLGFDYAYSGGSYYSAVLNEIIFQRIPLFANIQLNKYGLFEAYDKIIDFINLRKTVKQKDCNEEEYLEEGDFIIYKLYELKI